MQPNLINKINHNLSGLYQEIALLDTAKSITGSWGKYLSISNSEWPNVLYDIHPAEIHALPIDVAASNPMLIIEEDEEDDLFAKSMRDMGYRKLTRWTAMSMQHSDADGFSVTEDLHLIEPGDLQQLQHWQKLAHLSLFQSGGVELSFLEELIQNKSIKLWLGSIDKVPVFTMLSYHKGSVAGLYAISVHPDYRSRGLAEMFLHQATDGIFDLGYKHLVLQANVLSHPLYSRLGFEIQGYYSIYHKHVFKNE